MKVFKVQYRYCWEKQMRPCFIAAEDLSDAKKRVKKIIEENWDVVEYVGFEYYVEESNITLEFVLSTIKQTIPESKIAEYCIKDVIE